jgi:hypothetical protein
MARHRSATATTLGVVNIIFGLISLALGCCVGFGLYFVHNAPPNSNLVTAEEVEGTRDMWEFMRRDQPLFGPAVIFGCVMGFVTGAVLIVTGIGLLSQRNWARITCIIYAVFNGALLVGDVLFRLFIELPAQERWRADYLRRHPDVFFIDDPLNDMYFNQVMFIALALFSLVYMLVLVIVLLMPPVAAAFARRPVYEVEDDDDYAPRRPNRDWEY